MCTIWLHGPINLHVLCSKQSRVKNGIRFKKKRRSHNFSLNIWCPFSNGHWVSPVLVIISMFSTPSQGCLFSEGCCKIINVTLKDVSSTWLPSLPPSVFISIPGCSFIFRLELTVWTRIDSHRALCHWIGSSSELYHICLPRWPWK